MIKSTFKIFIFPLILLYLKIKFIDLLSLKKKDSTLTASFRASALFFISIILQAGGSSHFSHHFSFSSLWVRQIYLNGALWTWQWDLSDPNGDLFFFIIDVGRHLALWLFLLLHQEILTFRDIYSVKLVLLKIFFLMRNHWRFLHKF